MRSLPRIETMPTVVQRPVDLSAITSAAEILEDVRTNGEGAIRRFSEHYGDLFPGDQIVYDREELDRALEQIGPDERQALDECGVTDQAFRRGSARGPGRRRCRGDRGQGRASLVAGFDGRGIRAWWATPSPIFGFDDGDTGVGRGSEDSVGGFAAAYRCDDGRGRGRGG